MFRYQPAPATERFCVMPPTDQQQFRSVRDAFIIVFVVASGYVGVDVARFTAGFAFQDAAEFYSKGGSALTWHLQWYIALWWIVYVICLAVGFKVGKGFYKAWASSRTAA